MHSCSSSLWAWRRPLYHPCSCCVMWCSVEVGLSCVSRRVRADRHVVAAWCWLRACASALGPMPHVGYLSCWSLMEWRHGESMNGWCRVVVTMERSLCLGVVQGVQVASGGRWPLCLLCCSSTLTHPGCSVRWTSRAALRLWLRRGRWHRLGRACPLSIVHSCGLCATVCAGAGSTVLRTVQAREVLVARLSMGMWQPAGSCGALWQQVIGAGRGHAHGAIGHMCGELPAVSE